MAWFCLTRRSSLVPISLWISCGICFRFFQCMREACYLRKNHRLCSIGNSPSVPLPWPWPPRTQNSTLVKVSCLHKWLGEAETQIPPQIQTPPLAHLDAFSNPFLTPRQKPRYLRSALRNDTLACSLSWHDWYNKHCWVRRETDGQALWEDAANLVSCLSHGWLS